MAEQTTESADHSRHRVSKVAMTEGLGALVREMDELASEGWEAFHVHECYLSGAAWFLVLSRQKSADVEI